VSSPGYQVLERARPRTERAATSMKTNHGGVCVFIRSDLRVKVVDFPSYNYRSSCYRCSCGLASCRSCSLSSTVKKEPASAVTDMFFVDWADVLERTAAYAGCLIVGDVNLHVDDVASTSTERFLTLLDSFGLRDYVGQSTRGDHQLDILVSRSDLVRQGRPTTDL